MIPRTAGRVLHFVLAAGETPFNEYDCEKRLTGASETTTTTTTTMKVSSFGRASTVAIEFQSDEKTTMTDYP
jgi:hypothetical protein